MVLNVILQDIKEIEKDIFYNKKKYCVVTLCVVFAFFNRSNPEDTFCKMFIYLYP